MVGEKMQIIILSIKYVCLSVQKLYACIYAAMQFWWLFFIEFWQKNLNSVSFLINTVLLQLIFVYTTSQIILFIELYWAAAYFLAAIYWFMYLIT